MMKPLITKKNVDAARSEVYESGYRTVIRWEDPAQTVSKYDEAGCQPS